MSNSNLAPSTVRIRTVVLRELVTRIRNELPIGEDGAFACAAMNEAIETLAAIDTPDTEQNWDLDDLTKDEIESERRRVQHKLTDICSDIWDLARYYDVSTKANHPWNEERATLRRLVEVLSGKERLLAAKKMIGDLRKLVQPMMVRAVGLPKDPYDPQISVYEDPDGDEDMAFARGPKIVRMKGEPYGAFKARAMESAKLVAEANPAAIMKLWDALGGGCAE